MSQDVYPKFPEQFRDSEPEVALTEYRSTGEFPITVEAFQVTCSNEPTMEVVTPEGALGKELATDETAVATAEFPTEFVATTVAVYVTPSVRPVIGHEVLTVVQ